MADKALRIIGAVASVNIAAWALYLAATLIVETGKHGKAHLGGLWGLPFALGLVASFIAAYAIGTQS